MHVDRIPASVLEAGRRLALPVVVLHRRVRFVDVTEQVHREIVADQYAEVAYGQRVHEAFTALSLRRASIEQILDEAADMLDTPIVLEDLNRQGAGLRRPRGARRGAAGRLAAPFPADVLDGLPGRSPTERCGVD